MKTNSYYKTILRRVYETLQGCESGERSLMASTELLTAVSVIHLVIVSVKTDKAV